MGRVSRSRSSQSGSPPESSSTRPWSAPCSCRPRCACSATPIGGCRSGRGPCFASHSRSQHPRSRPHRHPSPDGATERFSHAKHTPLSASTHRRALAAAQPRALAGQVAAGDPALRRPLLPLDRLRGSQRARLLRDPLHRPLPEGVVRLQRRRPPLVMARRLKDAPDYPARLQVDYPESLSRGLVLVKWWLLAIPHYLVVAVFAGCGWAAWPGIGNGWMWSSGGLVGLLVFFAGVVLLFTGRYPKSLYDFVLGMNRWVFRVAAYASLMTDAYPPFRLDMGGDEPPSGTAPDTVPTTPAPVTP